MSDSEDFDSWVDKRHLLPPPQSETKVQVTYQCQYQLNAEPVEDESKSAKVRELLNLVRQGDVAKAAEFLRRNPDTDLNKKTMCKFSSRAESALSIAVSRGDEEMVRLLSSISGLQVSDCVLLAAEKGHAQIVVMLLDLVLWTEGAEAEDRGCDQSERFPPHATPLLVAASSGQFAVVRLLVQRGHRIQPPHAPCCSCNTCRHCWLDPVKGLEANVQRLSTYKAMSNPAFIFATANDPFLQSFTLHQEISKCAESGLAFSSSYTNLAENLAKFSEDLIACCRTNDEVNGILQQKIKGHTSLVILPRLQLAMESEQKEFVAHPFVQHVVYTKWVGASPSWATTSNLAAVLHLLARIAVLPFLVFLLIVAPFSNLANRLASPVNRLVSHLASYLVFLVLITVQGHVAKNNTGRTTTGLEPIIGVFLLGHEINLTRMLILKGFRRFFGKICNIYDLLMVQLLWSWLWVWYTASGHHCEERKFWPSLHPVLVAEGLLAIGTIVAYGRILFLCQLSHKFGPMQVSLSKMFRDVAQCSLLFFLVILSFSAGVGGLYHYYEGMSEAETGYSIVQPPSFTNLFDSLRFLFWGVFGLSPPEYTTVVLEGTPDGAHKNHHFTQAVGTICFAVYMLIVNVMLLNVLVAKMTNTYKRVTSNVELEWTFGKTELVLDYMYQSVLPPPLNLIPTTRSIVYFVRLQCPKRSKEQDEETELFSNEAYNTLLGKLKSRYTCFRDEQELIAPTRATEVIPDPNPPTINSEVVAKSVSLSLGESIENEFEDMRKELKEVHSEMCEIIKICSSRSAKTKTPK